MLRKASVICNRMMVWFDDFRENKAENSNIKLLGMGNLLVQQRR